MNKSEDSTPGTATVLSEEALQSVTGGAKLLASLDSVLRQYRQINVASIQRGVLNRESLINFTVNN